MVREPRTFSFPYNYSRGHPHLIHSATELEYILVKVSFLFPRLFLHHRILNFTTTITPPNLSPLCINITHINLYNSSDQPTWCHCRSYTLEVTECLDGWRKVILFEKCTEGLFGLCDAEAWCVHLHKVLDSGAELATGQLPFHALNQFLVNQVSVLATGLYSLGEFRLVPGDKRNIRIRLISCWIHDRDRSMMASSEPTLSRGEDRKKYYIQKKGCIEASSYTTSTWKIIAKNSTSPICLFCTFLWETTGN